VNEKRSFGTLLELLAVYHVDMAHETTHIVYEWEPFTEVEMMGKARRYSLGYRSLIVHRLADLALYTQIPDTALTTPCWYSGYRERWFLANGEPLELPNKLLV
jgi:hypothetical protein